MDNLIYVCVIEYNYIKISLFIIYIFFKIVTI